MEQTEIFYKLVTANLIGNYVSQRKKNLQEESSALAGDSVLLKRRFRMLSQLSQYETQIYKKIYHFHTNDLDDYAQASEYIIKEIDDIINRNS